jgi:GDP-L-fucose synthase
MQQFDLGENPKSPKAGSFSQEELLQRQYRKTNARIFVAGHRGLVGSAIVRQLKAKGYTEILTASRDELDLLDQAAVRRFFRERKPEQVYMAAAKVGGIHANSTFQADFLYQNLTIAPPHRH